MVRKMRGPINAWKCRVAGQVFFAPDGEFNAFKPSLHHVQHLATSSQFLHLLTPRCTNAPGPKGGRPQGILISSSGRTGGHSTSTSTSTAQLTTTLFSPPKPAVTRISRSAALPVQFNCKVVTSIQDTVRCPCPSRRAALPARTARFGFLGPQVNDSSRIPANI